LCEQERSRIERRLQNLQRQRPETLNERVVSLTLDQMTCTKLLTSLDLLSNKHPEIPFHGDFPTTNDAQIRFSHFVRGLHEGMDIEADPTHKTLVRICRLHLCARLVEKARCQYENLYESLKGFMNLKQTIDENPPLAIDLTLLCKNAGSYLCEHWVTERETNHLSMLEYWRNTFQRIPVLSAHFERERVGLEEFLEQRITMLLKHLSPKLDEQVQRNIAIHDEVDFHLKCVDRRLRELFSSSRAYQRTQRIPCKREFFEFIANLNQDVFTIATDDIPLPIPEDVFGQEPLPLLISFHAKCRKAIDCAGKLPRTQAQQVRRAAVIA
jgi:hypothetical protein